LNDNSHAVNILLIKSHCRFILYFIFNFVSSYFSIRPRLTLN